jgi:hypothetical protein
MEPLAACAVIAVKADRTHSATADSNRPVGGLIFLHLFICLFIDD